MYTWRMNMRVRKRRKRFYLVTALTLDAVVVSLLFVVAALLQWTGGTPIHCYLLFNCSALQFSNANCLSVGCCAILTTVQFVGQEGERVRVSRANLVERGMPS